MAAAVFSPAKLNLFLAITGRRADGYHDLLSVAAPLDFGDELEAKLREPASGNRFTLTCDRADVPVDGTNLVLKAAAAFASATGWEGGADFKLTKRIPVGAGLGGGSSNAVAALRLLNELTGIVWPDGRLAEIAGTLGSDCVLFLERAPVVMRGRGERVEALPPAAAARIRGRRVLLFKPSFGINTPWAYGRMVAAAQAGRTDVYLPASEAEQRLARWLESDAPLPELLFNNMQAVAFDKYVALPTLLERIRRDFGVAALMSGSGSACFLVLSDAQAAEPIVAAIASAWGPTAFVREVRLA